MLTVEPLTLLAIASFTACIACMAFSIRHKHQLQLCIDSGDMSQAAVVLENWSRSTLGIVAFWVIAGVLLYISSAKAQDQPPVERDTSTVVASVP